MTISSIAIVSIALSFDRSLNDAMMADAFAWRESSRRVHVPGDNGKAWGLFQFHRDRWREVGGKDEEWGKAGARRQAEVMLLAMDWYRKRADRRGVILDTVEKEIIWFSRWHNIGSAKRGQESVHTRYSTDLLAKFRAIEAARPAETADLVTSEALLVDFHAVGPRCPVFDFGLSVDEG